MAKVNKRRQDNLPSAPSIFVGRQREIAQIERALADPAINVVTIYGIAGTGKTVLARFVVERQREHNRFPGGIVWVDCRLDDSLHKILTTIAQSLGLESAPLPLTALRDVVVSHLRSTPSLLVLDAYELVAQNDEVLSFVGRLPKPTKALIVSREHIRIPGREITVRLDSLTESETAELLKRHLNPDQWAEIDQDAIQAIHRRTGGLPLAVDLAADLFKQGWSLPQVIEELREEAMPNKVVKYILRQIDTTLSEQQRQFLDALSVFAHPVDGKAVAAILEFKNWRLLGDDLTRKSIVEVVNGRYALHPLVRAYLRSRISSKRFSTLQQRMVEYFLAYSEKFEDDFDQLDREWLNIRYSIETAYRNALWQEFAELILTVGKFLDARGYESEYQQWLSRAIEVSEKMKDRRTRAALLHNLGVQYQRRGDFSAALRAYEQSLQSEKEIEDRLGESATLAQLGTIYYQQGDLNRAEQFYRNALEISRKLEDRHGEGNLLGNLALVAMNMERFEDAEELFQRALSISREIGDRNAERSLLSNLGSLAIKMKRSEEANMLFQQALYISREIGDRNAEASLFTNMGSLAMNMRRFEEAEERFQRALAISREIGDRKAEAGLLTNMGSLAMNMRRFEEAEERFQRALAISREIGDRNAEASLLGNLGAVYSDLPTGDRAENLRQAIEFLNRALEHFSKDAYPREYATLHNNLATWYASLPSGDSSENFKQAIAHYKEALRIYTVEVYPMQWAATQNNLGMAYSQLEAGDRTENLRQAIASYERALRVYTRKSFPYDWLRVSTSLGTAYADVGDWQKAKQLATSVLQAFHGAIPDQESLDALIPWYERLGDLAINNQDVEFATRVFAEVAHRFEIQELEVPGNIRDKLVRLREQIGDDRFVIIWGEVQGALTPYLAQVLREATQLIEQGRFELAENKFTKALKILSETEDTQEQRRQHATLLFQRGFCLRNQERWEEALLDLETAFHLFEELKDFGAEARVLLEMGHIYGVMNNYEEARLHYMDAYRLYRRAKNKSGMAMASESMGQLEFVVRMFPQAIQDLEEARQLYIQLGERGAASAIESNLEDAKASFSHQEANAGRRGKQK